MCHRDQIQRESYGECNPRKTKMVVWIHRLSQSIKPVFPEKRQAISYAQERACFRSGEIRILDSSGDVERVVSFDDTNRKL